MLDAQGRIAELEAELRGKDAQLAKRDAELAAKDVRIEELEQSVPHPSAGR
ncbi:MAG: hypothetical protein MJE77_46685 [Proteobacteria bacterium]|nr:hypothetical protein [Pseudomonadota bacterium]